MPRLGSALSALALLLRVGVASAGDETPRPPQAETPARPALPPEPRYVPVPWQPQVDVGGEAAYVSRFASHDALGQASQVKYRDALGFGVHARWELFRHVGFTAYFLDAHHTVELPPGALGITGSVTMPRAATYSFGARVSPTLYFTGDRIRVWATGGIGWGRMEFARADVTEGGRAFTLKERTDSFVEFPFGVGASAEILPRWVRLELEVLGIVANGSEGDAVRPTQAIDAGHTREIGAFPELDGAIVVTGGVSIIL